MSIRTIRIIQLILLVLPFILVVVLWDKIPDPVPVFWNNGPHAKFEPKMWHVFDRPLQVLAIYLVMLGGLFLLRNKGNYIYGLNIFMAINMIFGTSIEVIALLKMCKLIAEDTDYLWTSMAVSFLLYGNFMAKMRPNYLGGIRTPWTLASEEVWVKTHRMTGYLWVTGAIIMLVAPLIPSVESAVVICTFFIMLIVPFIYSYILHKRRTTDF